jgi:hypothetical protein
MADAAFKPGTSLLLDVRQSGMNPSAEEVRSRAEWLSALSTKGLSKHQAVVVDVLQKRFCRRTEPIANLPGIEYSIFQSEGFLDELDLPKDIPFWQPPHLAFPDHVQCLVALNGPPRSIERSKTLAGIHPPFDPSMVLFHDII